MSFFTEEDTSIRENWSLLVVGTRALGVKLPVGGVHLRYWVGANEPFLHETLRIYKYTDLHKHVMHSLLHLPEPRFWSSI